MKQADAQALIGRVFGEVIDGDDYSRIGELFDPDFIDHGALGETRGHDAFTGMLQGFRAALPDYRHEVSDVTVLDGTTVIWQVHVIATFDGEMMGVSGEGQPVDLWVANAARVRGGRIVEHWGLGPEGAARMMGQMGLQQPALG
jgi:predicted ester cyclase